MRTGVSRTPCALAKALADYATAAKAAVEGGASLGAYGIVEVTSNIDRQGFVEGAPDTLLPAVFGMAVGALQVILDKGNDLDWFESNFIIIGAAISVIALAVFVIG